MMSRLSKLDRDQLNVLRISQDPSEGENTRRVNFEIAIRGRTMFKDQASFSDLGLPENLDVFEQDETEELQFHLPYELTGVLSRLMVEQMSDRTLWLDIDLLDKHLAIVPWERLVSEHLLDRFGKLPVNILRVPDLLFLPALFGRTTNIVLCASERQGASGESKWHDLYQLIMHIFESPDSNRIRVHVFTDALSAKKLKYELSAGYVDRRNVLVYDPETPLSYSPSESARDLLSQQGQLDNEWLTWIVDVLRDVTVDVVHFFCDGCMSLEQGALVFSASPRPEGHSERERFANAQQIDFFLTQIGAYSVALTATEGCSSIVGLRLLSTQLARLRTGPVLLHYAGSDRHFDDLCIAYRFLYTHRSNELELSQALTLHCAPTLIHKDLEETSLRFADSLNYLWSTRNYLQEVTGRHQEHEQEYEQEYEQERERESLAWAVAAYRFMEKMAAGLNREESTFEDEPHPIVLGMREAINHAADSVHAYARRLNNDSNER